MPQNWVRHDTRFTGACKSLLPPPLESYVDPFQHEVLGLVRQSEADARPSPFSAASSIV